MFVLIIGGSGSGKSAYAEKRLLAMEAEKKHYIATMRVFDEEGKKRVEKHRTLRREKGFLTIEKPIDLGEIALDAGDAWMLECVSNLLANEMYMGNHKQWFLEEKESGETAGARLLCRLLKTISEKTANLVIVTNETFSDGGDYDRETESFIIQLGYLNRQLAKEADGVVEVVCGIPLWQKGREKC